MKFDIFLSHNSREKPAVERIAEKLKRDGIEPWLDISRDGKFVLAADKDGTVRVYACDLCVSHEDLLKLAQKRRMRELTPDERTRYLR
ncbi:MAG TPA: hypothetical protein VGC87_00985 [Pyrinomonadaceae bacterium]|jgi:hypothetical protein